MVEDKIPHYPWDQFKRFGLVVIGFGSILVFLGYVYRSVFLSVILSLLLTYILYPMVTWLQGRIPLRRSALVMLLVVVIFGLILAAAALFLPVLYYELIGIVKKVPQAIAYLHDRIEPIKEWFVHRGYLGLDSANQIFGQINLNLSEEFSKTTTNALRQLWSTTPWVLGGALNLMLVPLFTWFLLQYASPIKAFILNLVPYDLQPMAQLNTQKINKILWAVIKGQVVVALMLSLLYMVGFSLISLQSGLAIGALAGICRVVPYLDVLVGALLSLIVIVSQGGTFGMAVAVAVVIGVVQAIDGMFITPRIIGERAGVHPVVVIASVIAFGDLFGILGILIAVPVVAIVSASFQMALPYYRNSPFYRQG